MKKVTMVVALLGLTISGVGIGAGLAAVIIGKSPIASLGSFYPTGDNNLSGKSPENLSKEKTGQSCRLNSVVAVNNSLGGLWQATQFVTNPLPTVVNFNKQSAPDLIASINPAPFPNISDRSRLASVPIIMYHDIAKNKQVSWDVTPEELEQHFATIQANGLTPISMDELVHHLRTGVALPPKPILLTFDDNYEGQYNYAFPLLKKYNYPAVWSVHTRYVGVQDAKPKATWEQLREMYRSGLITIASHTVNHLNLQKLSDLGSVSQIEQELTLSKQAIEQELGIKVRYFTYPEGAYTSLVKEKVKEAGYEAALSMSLNPEEELPAETSEDLLAIRRYGQSRFQDAVAIASNGIPEQDSVENVDEFPDSNVVNFGLPITKKVITFDNLPITLVSGGRPVTVHHHTRDQVEIVKKTANAIAAVDGTFFSLEFLDSNKMIGPVMSQFSKQAGVFINGNKGENPLLNGRPLVLISPSTIKFVTYEAAKHNSKENIQAELPDVTDAFVAAGWLVRDGEPQKAASFGKLYGFDANRDRAFWGIDRKGRPVIGVTMEMIDSVGLGKYLAKAGLQQAVMLDSGASAALAYKGKSVMNYIPRPVPHVVALLNPDRTTAVKWGGAIMCSSRN